MSAPAAHPPAPAPPPADTTHPPSSNKKASVHDLLFLAGTGLFFGWTPGDHLMAMFSHMAGENPPLWLQDLGAFVDASGWFFFGIGLFFWIIFTAGKTVWKTLKKRFEIADDED